MRKILICGTLLLLVTISQAQVTYVSAANVLAPPVPSVDLSVNNSTEFRGINDITLKAGFSAVQNTNTNTAKYFWAYIEYAPTAVQYALLEKEYTSSYVPTTNGVLYFAYDEKYTTGVLNYQIYDYTHTPLITSALKTAVPGLNLTRTVVGKNFFQIDMNTITGLSINSEQQRYFTLEVTNDKNEKFVLRFKHP